MLGLLDPEGEGSTVVVTVRKYLRYDTAWNFRRLESSATPL